MRMAICPMDLPHRYGYRLVLFFLTGLPTLIQGVCPHWRYGMIRYRILLGSLAAILWIAGVLGATSTSPLLRTTVASNTPAAGLAQTNQGSQPAGENFKGFRFGAHRKDVYRILKVRPIRAAHVAEDEEGCEFYSPEKDIQIGDFTVRQGDIYLVFWKDRLMRIRIINTFSGMDDVDIKFFSAMRGALTQKYGNAPSKEQIFTRYDGLYEWKTPTLRVNLQYSMLEYGWIELERELAASLKKSTRINSNDI